VDTTTDLIAVKVLPLAGLTKVEGEQRAGEVQEHLEAVIKGQALPFTDENLQKQTDLSKVRKVYKLHTVELAKEAKLSNGASLKLEQCQQLEGLVLGLMAIRGS
jgi:EKC/KEOPS complex subunit CGI121/TPRKB